MSNVILIKGKSQYDAMRYYIDEIELGFRLAGYNTILLDTKERSFLFQLDELLKSVKIDLVFTCNGIIYDVLRERMPDVLYVTYLCDHPTIHLERIQHYDKNTVVFVCDALHEKFIKEYYKIKYVKYIPLAGSSYKKQVPYRERKYDIIFTGTYRKPEESYNQLLSELSGSLKPFGEYVLKKIVEIPELTIEECLKKALEEHGITVSKDEFAELVYEYIWADAWARHYYRDRTIRSLIENGLDVHVFGNGWEDFESDFKDHLIIEKGNSYLARKAVANAKISLNMMPWLKAGFQERIAAAMLNGAVAVSDKSSYICDNFTDGEDIVLYSLRDLGQLPVKIRSLLEDEEAAEKIAEKGRERAENELTWQHRTFDMIAYIKEEVHENRLVPAPSYGKVIKIPYQNTNQQTFAVDVIKAIDNFFDMLEHIRQYDQLELCDIQYFYMQFLYLFMKVKANFPEVDLSDYVYNFLMNLDEKDLTGGIDLFIMELSKLQNGFLKAEFNRISTENDEYKQQMQSLQNTPSTYAYKLLIHKLESNYQTSDDPEIRQILENIKKQGYVLPYNQNFVKNHIVTEQNRPKIYYDADAGMYYVFLDNKRMYYPKGHSEGSVLGQVCFCYLEQDINSPHRYLDKTFQVSEGDIIIDAGVAEGNFALSVVEKAKKVYLVECEHEWVEALEKTFEPWKEKVVIVEKMLGNQDDDTHIMIDSFVEEGEVNFIKLDVEGAEIDSLKGASKVLENSKQVKCAICAYHRKNAEKDIRAFLEEKGFYTTTTKGYMFFKEDMDSWTDGELRRGIVRAVKNR